MANIASQKKRILRSERERTENRLLTSTVKTHFRRLESAVESGDAATIAGRTITFDGQWRKSKVSEADYTSAFTTAEQEYTRLLGLLIAEAKVK